MTNEEILKEVLHWQSGLKCEYSVDEEDRVCYVAGDILKDLKKIGFTFYDDREDDAAPFMEVHLTAVFREYKETGCYKQTKPKIVDKDVDVIVEPIEVKNEPEEAKNEPEEVKNEPLE